MKYIYWVKTKCCKNKTHPYKDKRNAGCAAEDNKLFHN
jgi:hypothetical protein